MKAFKTSTDYGIKRRLELWFSKASHEQYEAGINWYDDAQQYVQWLAHKYGLTNYHVACVLSVLSPLNKWERNKLDAEELIDAWHSGRPITSFKVCTYGRNKKKAWDILDNQETLTEVSAKTHSFAMNVGMLSESHVTIDRWHIRACLSVPSTGVDMELPVHITDKQYRRVEALTAELAAKYKLKAYQMQAIIWLVVREWDK